MRKFVCCLIVMAAVVGCGTKGDAFKSDIKHAFLEWKKSEISEGHYFAMDSCNGDYFVRMDSLGLESSDAPGIPDEESEIEYDFADLNSDGKQDALITFAPRQCDGGNAAMWSQIQLLALSHNNSYKIDAAFFDEIDSGKGFFHLDSAATSAVFGTYYEFGENDGHCCPGIEKPIRIDMGTKKLEFYKKR
ncbi:hypothetical protein HUK80_00275 [Flavobacterium sp. MAH-1]|uniref:Lipoprotein n=1 Tax=Flavobacterium agri TaxID=2743471 RepID=A0A7Y8XZ10_9FLAO|nr:hypothetical protein [Flavobacterium agri]NUY79312.1 hypothetical protein [Flavobacterium agri]NYA69336.1 hypothetical protein [Flavobacterium agri]